jgi:hypothetical protein
MLTCYLSYNTMLSDNMLSENVEVFKKIVFTCMLSFFYPVVEYLVAEPRVTLGFSIRKTRVGFQMSKDSDTGNFAHSY